jgi:hypothetical protein
MGVKTMLTKQSARATTDTTGCQFHYLVFIDKSFNASLCKTVTTKDYVCVEFPNITAPTLAELKEKMGAL